jgi:hypothetical protein
MVWQQLCSKVENIIAKHANASRGESMGRGGGFETDAESDKVPRRK